MSAHVLTDRSVRMWVCIHEGLLFVLDDSDTPADIARLLINSHVTMPRSYEETCCI